MARSKRQSKPRNDLPPERDSPLVTTSVANILDAIVMRDPQWTWVTDEWQRSDNDAHADLLSRIDAHRNAIATEIAKMLDQIVAPIEEPPAETVKIEPSADLKNTKAIPWSLIRRANERNVQQYIVRQRVGHRSELGITPCAWSFAKTVRVRHLVFDSCRINTEWTVSVAPWPTSPLEGRNPESTYALRCHQHRAPPGPLGNRDPPSQWQWGHPAVPTRG
jgi:hypothetical protein